jgi:probable F420-dependent oxidoreductase
MFANAGPFVRPDLFGHLARAAEQFGFESIWTVEHVVIPQGFKTPYPYSADGRFPGGEDVPMPDPVVPLAYAAALTTRLKLGTGIMILPQRHPFYVAKELATLDQLSNGRAMLGVDAGWLREEFQALGIDFESRGARTDEALRALRALWRDDPSSFHGIHFDFGPVKSFPKPVQKGGVPIHVGGHSPAAARRAARLGDGFFPAVTDLTRVKDLFEVMKAECGRVGRNPSEMELSCAGPATLEWAKAAGDLGVARLLVPPPAWDADGLTRELEKIANQVLARL